MRPWHACMHVAIAINTIHALAYSTDNIIIVNMANSLALNFIMLVATTHMQYYC